MLTKWRITRSKLAQETATYVIPMTSLRVWDNFAALLPATAANDDMGMNTETWASYMPRAEGVDFGGGSTDEKSRFQFALPPEYVSAGAVTVRLRAGMTTRISDGTATVDVQCYKSDRDGTPTGSPTDLCATNAQSINSATLADKDFTITATSLVAGDLLDFRLAFAGSDSGDAGDYIIPVITQIEIRLAVKG